MGVVLLLGVGATPAAGYVGPVTDPQHIDDVLGYLTKGSPTQIPGIDTSSPRVADWWEQEHRPIPGQPSSSQLHDDLRAARSRLGLLPRLGTFAKFTLTGAAVTVAIQYAPDLFQEIGLWPKPSPQPAVYEPVEIQLYEPGEWVTSSGSLASGVSYAYPKFRRAVKVATWRPSGTTNTPRATIARVFNEPQPGVSPHDWVPTPSQQGGNGNCGPDLAIPTLDPPARRWFAGSPGSPPVDPATVPVMAPPPSYCDNPPAGVYSAFAVVQRMTEKESRMVEETDAPVVLHAPENWSGKCTTRECVEGRLEGVLDEMPDLAQYLEHLIDPETANPYPPPARVIVPDCDGLLWPACRDLLEEAGLEPQRDELDWRGAVIEKPARAVVETRPGPGAEVDVGRSVTVVTNPNEDGMPIVVPQPSEDPNEHYRTYLDELERLGFPEPLVQELTESTYNPNRGPSAVASVVPAPGTRFDPAGPLPQVAVNVNPPTVPIVDDGGSCEGLELHTIDVSPLFVDLGDRFPFGLPGYVEELFDAWTTTAAPPNFSIPLTANVEWGIDFTKAEPAMEIIRPVIVIVSAIGVFTATLAACWGAWARFFGGQGDAD